MNFKIPPNRYDVEHSIFQHWCLVIEPTPRDGHTYCSKKTKNNADAHESVKWVSLTEKELFKTGKLSYCAANNMNSWVTCEKCKNNDFQLQFPAT